MKTKAISIFKVAGLLVAGAVLAGCSVDASITNLTPSVSPPVIFEKSSGAEFVSGSTPLETTQLRGYKVQASAGHFLGEPRQVTPRGYKVYSTVQGSLLSEQE